MADWCQFLNFEPATPEEVKAEKAGTQCPAQKAATCPAQATNTCNQNTGNLAGAMEPMIGAPKSITDLLGNTVMGKSGEVEVVTFARPKSVVGLFFSGHWCPPSRTFTPELVAFYKRFKDQHRDKQFEIVFISSDRSEDEFIDYWGEMPWLAFPFNKRTEKNLISKKFGVRGIPTLILLDGGTGAVITKEGRDIPADDPTGNDFPWKTPTIKEILKGNVIDNKGVEYTIDFALMDKVVGIFFSGHWCPPSQAFTPGLVEAYNRFQRQGKQFEIIFCSWDRSKEEFDEYFAEMPWMAIPYQDKRATQLKKLYNVEGIPHLHILDRDLKTITKNGRSQIEADPEGEGFPWYPKPLTRLSRSTADIVNEHATVILIAENESDIPDIENVLLDLSKEHLAKGENQEVFFTYITAEKADAILDAVRKICNLRNDYYPILVILDIPNEKYYLYEGSAPTAASSREFVDHYIQGKLSGSKMTRG